MPRLHALLSLQAFTWRDLVAVLLALTGLSIPLGIDYRWADRFFWVGSDFKTLYASTWLFVHGQDAFSVPGLVSVYRVNRVVLPPSLFGHMPVYPPFTLALLSPLALLPETIALDLWWLVSTGLFVCALTALLRFAAQELRLPFGWRLTALGLCAGSPLLSFSLDLGNVSAAVSALCILALCNPSGWAAAISLALALLLKPYLAVWVVLALALAFGPPGRRTAWRAAALASASAALSALALAFSGRLLPLLLSFRAMLNAESAAGSMSPTSHELLSITAQILSLDSLLGFAASHAMTQAISLGVVCFLLLAVFLCIRQPGFQFTNPTLRCEAAGVLVAIGLIASYHRAHDALLLCFLIPWGIARLRQHPRDLRIWALIPLYLAEMFGPVQSRLLAAASPVPQANGHFLIVRQAPLAALALALLLVIIFAASVRDSQLRWSPADKKKAA